MATIGEDCRSSLLVQGAKVPEARQLLAASVKGTDPYLKKEWS